MSSFFSSFGQPASSAATSSTTATAGSSLFGGLSNPTKTSGVNLSGTLAEDPLAALSVPLGGSSQPTTTSAQTASTPATGSLFGSLGTASSQIPKLSLNLGGASSQPPSSSSASASSVFGSLSASQPQQSSLFAAASQPAASQPSKSSLFGAAPASNQSTVPSLSGSTLFGSTNATTQPGTSSLFGSIQPQQASSSGAPKAQESASGLQSAAQASQAGAPDITQQVYFNRLLERSNKRKQGERETNNLEQLPSLQLGLGDISQRVRELGGSASKLSRTRGADSKAHYLLAASGISPGSALRDLESFNTATSNVTSIQHPPQFDTDTAAYVSNLQSQSTLALIADGLNRSARDFNKFLEDNVTMEWDAQRRRIYEHFGLVSRAGDNLNESFHGSPGPVERGSFGKSSRRGRDSTGQDPRQGSLSGRSTFGTSGMSKSVIGTPARAGASQAALFGDVPDKSASITPGGLDERILRDKERVFAEKVQQLNEARLAQRAYPVLYEFGQAEAQTGLDQSSGQLVDAYSALKEIVGEDPSVASILDSNAVKERQFASDYLDESPNSARSLQIRHRILTGSRRYLERSFFRSLEAAIAKNPREARLGGRPDTISKVRGYVNLRASRRDLAPDNTDLQKLNDEYCWVIIFYLLRSGHFKEAAAYVKDNGTAFRALDRNFPTYITNFIQSKDRRLDRNLQDRINAEYNQRTRIAPENSVDPYRMACYKVVGRCDLVKRSLDQVGQGVEDWIWLQFTLAREVNRVDEVAGEVFGLAEVREVIKDIGQRHFAKGGGEADGGYGVHFMLLILGGMFENAVAQLYPFQYVSAVHFAIALDYYGLLRVSDFTASESELLNYSTKQLPQINFGRMLGYYTRDFRAANVVAATDYLTLICLNADLPGESGRSQASLCHEALRELVLETREFAKLLGDVRADGVANGGNGTSGQRVKGAIERRLKLLGLVDSEDFLRTVTVQAAGVADDNGRTTDAVLLYHLAGEYDNVVVIINRALSEAIAVDIGLQPLKLEPLKPRSEGPVTGTSPQATKDAGSSLSLTAVDDPADLARNMMFLYDKNAAYYGKIRPVNRESCGLLLRMHNAKQLVAAERWLEALDEIERIGILPLTAKSSTALIRASATQTFPALPNTIQRNVGPLLLWTLRALSQYRYQLRQSSYVDPTRQTLAVELAQKARDLMVWAGMMRLRLPSRVYEEVARAGQEVDDW